VVLDRLRRQLIVAGLTVAATVVGQAGPTASPARLLAAEEGSTLRVYVGTYTGGSSRGIYRFTLDLATGALTPTGEPTESSNPSFLALHPQGGFLYAVNEDREGAVSAFAVDSATGGLRFLNREPSGGGSPCHLIVDRDGRNVLVANYGGSVAVLPVRSDGRLGSPSAVVKHQGASVDPDRQKGPHAHSVNLDPSNRYALVADLGLDKLLAYRFDPAAGTITPHDPPAAALAPGSGPRHFAFHPSGRHVYVLNELTSTVTVFSYRAESGSLAELQTVTTLPAGFDGKSYPAEVVLSADGTFLYASNRGHDSIAVFAVDPADGRLAARGHHSTLGRKPRNFALDPTGAFLLAANQDSDNIVVFRVDRTSGGLSPVGAPVAAPRPVCVRMVAPGR
jgi:6-phosphogluconolactonase